MLHVQTLGTLAILLDNHPLPITDRKAGALLVYLVVYAGKMFTRSHLAALLWSESDEKRASGSFRKLLSRVQKVLPEGMLVSEGRTVGLSKSAEFTLDLNQIDTNPLLYNGIFLGGIELRNASGWHDWLAAFREQLDIRIIARLDAVGQQAIANQRYAEAIRAFEHSLTLDDWREQTHRSLIEAYWRAGDRGAAMAQYERCREVLQQSLGVDVSAETDALIKRITTQTTASLGNVPARDLTPLVGRKADVAEIGRILTQEACRLLTLVGMGGIGKTRLAIAVARAQQLRFVDGVWFVDLANVTANQLAIAIAETLNISLQGREKPRHRLLNGLKAQTTLLVLDNFETLFVDNGRRDALQLVGELLRQAPNVKLLITSRERLNVRHEWFYGVRGLQQGVELFVQTAQRVAAGFVVSAENTPHIKAICSQLDGTPLAIELAAAWVRTLPVEAIAAELAHNLELLEATESDVPERQRSLSMVLEHAYAQLRRSEQKALRQLALFRGAFSREAAAEVANATLQQLTVLIDNALLYRVEYDRFRLHEALRQFAMEKLRDSAEQADTERRFAKQFLSQLADALPQLYSKAQQPTLARLNRDLENSLVAWDWALNNEAAAWCLSAERALFNLYRIPERQFELARTVWRDSVAQLEAIPKPTAAQTQLLAILRLRLAEWFAALGQLDVAYPLFTQVVEQGGDSAENHSTLGFLETVRGHMAFEPSEKVRHFQSAIDHHQQANTPFEAVFPRLMLANETFFQADYPAAKHHFEAALSVFRAVGDRGYEAIVLHNLAYVEEKLGNWELALDLMAQSQQLFAAINAPQRLYQSGVSLNLMLAYSALPLPKDLETNLQTWLAAAQADGNRFGEAWVIGRLGALAQRDQQYDQALAYYESALAIAQELNLWWGIPTVQAVIEEVKAAIR